jgi:phosphoribosylpyrophosphate synthetase
MITTGSTIEAATAAIADRWDLSSLMVVATHVLLVDDALHRLEKHSPSLVAVTNTVPSGVLPPSYRVSSVADLLADTISRLHGRR